MYLQIEDFGTVKLISNSRAKRIIIRFRENQFQVTHPPSMAIAEIEKLLREKKEGLLQLKYRSASIFLFTEENRFSTLTFDVVINRNKLNGLYTTLKDGILHISYPEKNNLKDPKMQDYIKSVVESACRSEAKRVLPKRVRELAALHGFRVQEVKINKSRSRWGSCSALKNINLSYFCMMLPSPLVDLVILHELCHTKEMNHGERFWALLHAVTQGRSEELTSQLKKFRLKW